MLHRRFSRAASLISIVAFAAPTFAQAPARSVPEETTITVNGTGRVERVPDYVDVIVGVDCDDKAAAGAQAAAEAVMNQTNQAITKLALKGVDLQTGSVDLRPRYERHDYSEDIRKIIGYRASITLRVRTTDLHAVSRIIDAALGAGSNKVDGVVFGIKEALEAREEAIKLAGKAVKRKAATLAASLDLKLGRVVTANTTSSMWESWRSNLYNSTAQVASSAPSSGDGGDVVVPGKIEVNAEVTVTFAASEMK